MSPTKRALSCCCPDDNDDAIDRAAASASASGDVFRGSAVEGDDDGWAMSSSFSSLSMSTTHGFVSPKRLRGGGGGFPNNIEDGDLPFDDIGMEPPDDDDIDDSDALMMMGGEPPAEEDEYIPPEAMEEAMARAVALTDRQRWERPAVVTATTAENDNNSNHNAEDLSFQWLDMDVVSGNALSSNPNKSRSKVVGQTGPDGIQVPILRTYGVTESGHSVCAFIHGYTPYAYFAVPAGCEVDESRLADLRADLTDRLQSAVRAGSGSGKESIKVVGIVVVRDHKSIFGYETPYNLFLKVYVSLPNLIPPLKRILEDGIMLTGIDASNAEAGSGMMPQFAAFEANVPFVLRFMVDRDVAGAGWLTLPQDAYQVRPLSHRETHCQLEVDVSYDDVVARKSEGEWNKIAPLRILSVDIECQGRKGHFPEAEQDPVIQIANTVTVYGQDKPIIQNVFTLKGCLPIVGAHVISSDNEEDMLMKWRAFLEASDPDIITGYNVQNFDIPYLLDRAEALAKGSSHRRAVLGGFAQWGRIRNAKAKMKDTMFQSSAYGRRANVETTVEGRVIFDMLPYMQRNHKLSSYSLNAVCAEFLGQQKEDVHHSIISDLQNGSDEDRHRLAVYCLKDAKLPMLLMNKLSVLINYIEMARVTGVPMSFLISRGQQIKVYSMILRKCRNEKLLVPTIKKSGNPTGTDVGYEGATVLDPIKNYYQVPIATLDFASLYPSIMMAYNLCYSTLVPPSDVIKLDPSTYKKSDNGHVFVHSHVKKGILPTILEELLAARKRAKKDMKNAPNDFERAVQNGRQLALKVSANSVYGFTGATVGQLPCVPIASSVTSYGRYLLERTKAFVEETYTKSNGYEHDAVVVYGDTDSVMVKFGTPTVADTFPLAIEAAAKASDIFPDPIQLEFEKVYFPYLLMNKKRYAGLMWTQVEESDKMDTKGLETVRRDNCALVRDVIQTSLDKILIEQDVKGAIEYVKTQISDLLQNKMDISQLVITKSLNKGAEYALGLGGKKEDYKVKQAHVELAARMRKRDAGSAPQMGDRVPYVIITGAKGAATYEKAEDPIYVLENNLPIDSHWYLTNQLSNPLTRIFEPIIPNVERTLLQGDHTRKIFIPTPAARKGSLMMFAVKAAQCLGCKTSVDKNQGYLCKYCRPRAAEIYLDKLSILREAETRYAELWSAAQRIHGTIHSDIMCTGDGCGCQFYRRKKVQADIKHALEVIDKFGA